MSEQTSGEARAPRGRVLVVAGSDSGAGAGIQADIIDAEGNSCGADEGGYLAVRAPWPGMMRTVHGNPQRFRES